MLFCMFFSFLCLSQVYGCYGATHWWFPRLKNKSMSIQCIKRAWRNRISQYLKNAFLQFVRVKSRCFACNNLCLSVCLVSIDCNEEFQTFDSLEHQILDLPGGEFRLWNVTQYWSGWNLPVGNLNLSRANCFEKPEHGAGAYFGDFRLFSLPTFNKQAVDVYQIYVISNTTKRHVVRAFIVFDIPSPKNLAFCHRSLQVAPWSIMQCNEVGSDYAAR